MAREARQDKATTEVTPDFRSAISRRQAGGVSADCSGQPIAVVSERIADRYGVELTADAS